MSDTVRPEAATEQQTALAELARLVRHLGDELAGYRRRALSAEARVKSLEELSVRAAISPERSFDLEKENVELKRRLEAARNRTRIMLDRVRFLRQQRETP